MAREVALPLELEEERPEPRRRLRRLLQTSRRHPLGVFGLICVSLLFFCGIFAEVNVYGIGLSIVPYDPQDIQREIEVLGTLAEPVETKDTELELTGSLVEAGSTFDMDGERIL
ncbi:MAG: hypothetical protein ACRD1T_18605, partial [Acidimicrobiia bacterium]